MRLLSFTLICMGLCAMPASAQVLAYDFNSGGAGPALNAGTGGTATMPLNGLMMTGTAPNGTAALAGDTSLAINGGDSGWVTNLPNGATIAFCIDTSTHPMVGNNAFSYLWGDNTAGSFRCFTDGAAGNNNLLVRGGGLTDTVVPNSHGAQGWTHVAWVYDAAAGQTYAYVNGTLVNTVAQTPNAAITGTGTLRVGGYSGSTDAMDTGQYMDDFFLYDNALTAAQINALANACIIQTYSINSPAASLTVDGQSSGITAPGQVSVGAGTPIAVIANTNVGGNPPWELAFTLNPTIPSGVVLSPTEILNIDPTDPTLTLLNNFFATPWPGFALGGLPVLPAANYGVQFAVMNPASTSGITFSGAADVAVVPCNGSNFDANASLPPGWSTPAGFMSWTVNAGGTTSSATGPTAAMSLPNYLYCETSGTGINAAFAVDTCAVQFSSLTNFNLDFDLSRIGATIGTLDIKIDDGTNTFPTTIMTYTGPDAGQAQGATEWSSESISLLPFLPSSGSAAFRFEYMSGSSFTGDIALDNVSFN